jgi:SagB-type dehydrogenase family enzyme
MAEKIGDKFHQLTKYNREKMESGEIDWNNKPYPYKFYKDKPIIKLLQIEKLSKTTLYSAIKERKSTRSFSKAPINEEQLSYLLWSSTGIQRKEFDFEYRTVPSAGALYPIETYLVVNNIKNLEQGVYHYNIKNHELEYLKTGDFGLDISRAALNQEMCSEASVVFIWSALFSRSKWKYGERAYRYIFLDAGHIAQNLALTSASLKFGCCHIAAFYDDEVNAIIGIDGISESAIYASVVGRLV